MNRFAPFFLTVLAAAVAAARREPIRPPAPVARPLLGLEAALPAGASDHEREHAAQTVRASGVNLFAVTVSWSDGEPSPGKYRLDALVQKRAAPAPVRCDRAPRPAARLGRSRGTSRRISRRCAFDDPRLSLRLGRFLDALEPALVDASTISLGYAADAYFATSPTSSQAYRRLFEGAVEFLQKKVPDLNVGVTTAAPTESAAPDVAAALHQESPVLFYLYAPFERDEPVRAPPARRARARLEAAPRGGGGPADRVSRR